MHLIKVLGIALTIIGIVLCLKALHKKDAIAQKGLILDKVLKRRVVSWAIAGCILIAFGATILLKIF